MDPVGRLKKGGHRQMQARDDTNGLFLHYLKFSGLLSLFKFKMYHIAVSKSLKDAYLGSSNLERLEP